MYFTIECYICLFITQENDKLKGDNDNLQDEIASLKEVRFYNL